MHWKTLVIHGLEMRPGFSVQLHHLDHEMHTDKTFGSTGQAWGGSNKSETYGLGRRRETKKGKWCLRLEDHCNRNRRRMERNEWSGTTLRPLYILYKRARGLSYSTRSNCKYIPTIKQMIMIMTVESFENFRRCNSPSTNIYITTGNACSVSNGWNLGSGISLLTEDIWIEG